jgi:hypothetical protein
MSNDRRSQTAAEPQPHVWVSYLTVVGESRCDCCGCYAYGRPLTELCPRRGGDFARAEALS